MECSVKRPVFYTAIFMRYSGVSIRISLVGGVCLRVAGSLDSRSITTETIA